MDDGALGDARPACWALAAPLIGGSAPKCPA